MVVTRIERGERLPGNPAFKIRRSDLGASGFLIASADLKAILALVAIGGTNPALVSTFWEAVFSRHRIVGLQHFSETGPLAVAQAAAVRLAGGISVGWHWSNFQFASATVLVAASHGTSGNAGKRE